MEIKRAVVAGSGTMGLGIAQVLAMGGYETVLYDIDSSLLHKAEQQIEKNVRKAVSLGKMTEDAMRQALSLITYTTQSQMLIADFIIEAIPEKIELKQQFFNEMAQQNSPHTLFATNTSSIPITQIASSIPNPERVVGVHFFNPAHIMKLVEVIEGAATSPEVTQQCLALLSKLGKKAVVAQDAPGFIVNRVARHYYVESLKLVEEGVVELKALDQLLKSSGFKMGPFELMDLIGVDTNYSVTESMFTLFNFENRFRPSRIQKQKVMAGHHGRKSGKGFYDYKQNP